MNNKIVKKAVKKPVDNDIIESKKGVKKPADNDIIKSKKGVKKPADNDIIESKKGVKLEKVKLTKHKNMDIYLIILVGVTICLLFIILAFFSSINKKAPDTEPVFILSRGQRTHLENGGNVTNLQKSFLENNKPLSNKSTIIEINRDEWSVTGAGKRYQLIDNGSAINVYDLDNQIDVRKYNLEFERKVGPLDVTVNWIDYVTFAILGLLGPIGFYLHSLEKKLNKLENKYPDFLRDLAEFWRGGLSLTKAVETLAQGEYGALNTEVKKMATQLSWGVAFSDVLNMFKDRVRTKTIERSVSLVDQANKAGGKISDILLTAANDAREIKLLEKERNAQIGHYIAVIYVSFCVYLAVIIILAYVFLPQISKTSEELGTGDEGGLSYIKAIDTQLITGLFFCSVLVQAVGNGMTAGLMGNASVPAGMKHGFLMLTLTWLTFKFFGIEVGF